MSSPALATPKRTLQSHGVIVHIHVAGADSGDRLSMLEYVAPPYFRGAPLHYHEKMTETFYVLQGALDVTVDGEKRLVYAGEYAIVHPGMRHAFRNCSPKPLRFLLIATPGGHDRFFGEMIDWMNREPQWPPSDKNSLVQFGLRHDTYYV